MPIPEPCIRCGLGASRQSGHIQPAALLEAAQMRNARMAEDYGISACIECGICSYSLPLASPPAHAIRTPTGCAALPMTTLHCPSLFRSACNSASRVGLAGFLVFMHLDKGIEQLRRIVGTGAGFGWYCTQNIGICEWRNLRRFHH